MAPSRCPKREAQQGATSSASSSPARTPTPSTSSSPRPTAPACSPADNLAKVDDLTTWLAAQAHVTSVISLTHPAERKRLAGADRAAARRALHLRPIPAESRAGAARHGSTSGGTTVITLTSNTQLDSDAGKALIDAIRAGDVGAAQGLTVQVGGVQALSLDFTRYLYGNFPSDPLHPGRDLPPAAADVPLAAAAAQGGAGQRALGGARRTACWSSSSSGATSATS